MLKTPTELQCNTEQRKDFCRRGSQDTAKTSRLTVVFADGELCFLPFSYVAGL